MSKTTERIRNAAKRIATRAGSAVRRAEKKVEKEVRRHRIKGSARRVAKVAAAAGIAALTTAVVEETARSARRRMAPARTGPATPFDVALPIPTDIAIERVTDALRAEGFGVLTRIDVQRIFREKFGVEFRSYTILGACNPTFALRALTARAEAGLLLPCNVTVESVPSGGSLVRFVNPEALLAGSGLADDPAVQGVAIEAGKHLVRAAEWLRKHAPAAVL